MAEYINRQELLDIISERNRDTCNGKLSCLQMKRMVEGIRAAEVFEVVRCRDCIHDGLTTCPLCYIEQQTLVFVNHDADFYCGKGERKHDRTV